MSNQEMLEQAGAQVRRLAEGAGIRPIAMAVDLTDFGRTLLPSMLSHQLVADHAVKMRLVARLDRLLERMTPEQGDAEQGRDSREVTQLCAATARFTERYRQGLMSLARLQRWPGMAPAARGKAGKPVSAGNDDEPEDDGPGGGKSMAEVLSELQSFNRSAESLLKDLDRAGVDTSTPSAPAAPPQTVPANRGRLRHGNPSGDYLAAPRCGARCRSGHACRQPAMANGRCRLHGGRSTGARTAAGLTRCRTATLVHGHRSAEIIQLKSDLARSGRRLTALTRLAKEADRQSERPTRRCLGEGGCPATEPAGARPRVRPQVGPRTSLRPTPLAGARPSSCAFIIDFLSAPPRTNRRSERPTPCPATNQDGATLGLTHAHRRPFPPPAGLPRHRAATG